MDKQKQLIMYFRQTKEEDRKEVYIYLFMLEPASNVIKFVHAPLVAPIV